MGSSDCLARSPSLTGHIPDLEPNTFVPYRIYRILTPTHLKNIIPEKTDWVPNTTDWVGWQQTPNSKNMIGFQLLNLKWIYRLSSILMGAKPPGNPNWER